MCSGLGTKINSSGGALFFSLYFKERAYLDLQKSVFKAYIYYFVLVTSEYFVHGIFFDRDTFILLSFVPYFLLVHISHDRERRQKCPLRCYLAIPCISGQCLRPYR